MFKCQVVHFITKCVHDVVEKGAQTANEDFLYVSLSFLS